MLEVVIAAWGVATIFLYRAGEFARNPDRVFTTRFRLFDRCTGLAAVESVNCCKLGGPL